MIETSQLQTLVAVAHAGTFSKAAEDLNVTQSAISQSIKNLEKKVGVTLFKRSGKRVYLTNEGERLFELGSTYLDQMSEAITDIRDVKDQMKGKVRIGTLTGVGKSWLSRKIVDFTAKYPDLSVELKMAFPSDLMTRFENLQLDGVILPEYALPSTGEKHLVGTEYSTLVFPDNPDFQINENITLEELGKYPLIMFEYNDSLFMKWCHKVFGKSPINIKRRLIINSHGNMLEAVHRGVGIAVMPTHVLKRSYFKDKIKTLGGKFLTVNQKFYFVHHKEAHELLRMTTFKNELMASINEDPLH